MVEVQITRFNHEILAQIVPDAKSTRFVAGVAHAPAADPDAEVQVTRHNHEVLASVPPQTKSTRFVAGVAHAPAADPDAEVQVTRHNHEVLGGLLQEVKSTRLVAGVAHAPAPDPNAEVQITRLNWEVLARSFIPLSACTVPALWELFAHNWADVFELETTYRTAVSRSPEKVSEDPHAALAAPAPHRQGDLVGARPRLQGQPGPPHPVAARDD